MCSTVGMQQSISETDLLYIRASISITVLSLDAQTETGMNNYYENSIHPP